jgi:hypothetical protein
MDVIIVSKTHMTNAACIGALATSGKYIRLLNAGGSNQPVDTEFEVRQVWEIEFDERIDKKPPHIEDVIIKSKKLKGTLKDELTMIQMVQRFNATIWKGSADCLFDGLLQWTDSGSGYVSENGSIPNNSVGFWIPDKDLTKRIVFEKVRYSYPKTQGWRSLPYVGFEEAVEIIPAGSLVRVSLARWWDTNKTTEHRCSLQLSGWYDMPKPKKLSTKESEDDDLPF